MIVVDCESHIAEFDSGKIFGISIKTDQLRVIAGNHGWEQEFANFQQSHNQPLAPQEVEAFERAFEEAKQGIVHDKYSI
jgi:hypothetical protein